MKLVDAETVRFITSVRHDKIRVRNHLMNPHAVVEISIGHDDEHWPFMLTLSEYPHIMAALLEVVDAEIAKTNDELRRLGVDPE